MISWASVDAGSTIRSVPRVEAVCTLCLLRLKAIVNLRASREVPCGAILFLTVAAEPSLKAASRFKQKLAGLF